MVKYVSDLNIYFEHPQLLQLIPTWYFVDDYSHVCMTIENNVFTENFDKLNKLNTVLNTMLSKQVVFLGPNSLVLLRCWYMPNKTDQKYISYICTNNFWFWPRSFLESILDMCSQIYNLGRAKCQNWFIIQVYIAKSTL